MSFDPLAEVRRSIGEEFRQSRNAEVVDKDDLDLAIDSL